MRKEREVYFGKKLIAGTLLDLADAMMNALQDHDVDPMSKRWALAHSTLLVKLAKRELS